MSARAGRPTGPPRSRPWRAVVLVAALALAALTARAGAQAVADRAAEAAGDLQDAIGAMQAAGGARDRVAALTRTIRAYEKGQGTLRDAARDARLREARLARRAGEGRARLGRILGALMQADRDPGLALLAHPEGPLGSVRAAMILSGAGAGLQAEADASMGEMREIADLRAAQAAAGATLDAGLRAARDARVALSHAIEDRGALPRRFTDDPAALERLLEGARTLDAFAAGLAHAPAGPEAPREFVAQKGVLPLPVTGTLVRRANEADAAGARRPGILVSTRPGALVTAPAAATIRYCGPLLDDANVMILEPGAGYLVVLAGMATLYAGAGEIVAAGAPLGLMADGTDAPGDAARAPGREDDSGIRETDALYIEVRQGARPVDPADWFTMTAAPDDAAKGK